MLILLFNINTAWFVLSQKLCLTLIVKNLILINLMFQSWTLKLNKRLKSHIVDRYYLGLNYIQCCLQSWLQRPSQHHVLSDLQSQFKPEPIQCTYHIVYVLCKNWWSWSFRPVTTSVLPGATNSGLRVIASNSFRQVLLEVVHTVAPGPCRILVPGNGWLGCFGDQMTILMLECSGISTEELWIMSFLSDLPCEFYPASLWGLWCRDLDLVWVTGKRKKGCKYS